MYIVTLLLTLFCEFIANADTKKSLPYVKYTYDIQIKNKPSDALSSSEHAYNNLAYSGLFTVTTELNYKTDVVDKYRFDYKNKLLELSFKKNIYFHDGSPIELKDILESLNYLIYKSPNKSSFSSILKIKIENKKINIYTSFKEPIIPLLASPLVKIWKIKNNTLIGSGPFKVENYDNQNGVLYLKKFNQHFNASDYNIDLIELHKVTEREAINNLNNGIGMDMADFVINNPIQHVFTSKVGILKKTIAASWIIAFNLNDKFLKDENLRKCLNHSFPRSEFVSAFLPLHQVATSFIPPILLLKNDSFEIIKEKKNNCQQMKNDIELTLDYPIEINDAEKQCRYISNHFKKVGLKIFCNLVDFNTVLKRINNKAWQISLLAISAEVPSINYLLNSFYSKSTFNLLNRKIKDLDQIIEKTNISNSKIMKFESFQKINDFLFDKNLVLTISHPSHFTLVNKCVKNLNLSSFGPSFLNYSGVSFDSRCYNEK